FPKHPSNAIYITGMSLQPDPQNSVTRCNRRSFLGVSLAAAALSPAAAQTARQQISATPAPRDWSRPEPFVYPDPDIIALDNRFRRYIVNNTVIKRLYTGTLWSEGPAW